MAIALPPVPAPRYDVVGIGNALVDVIAHAPDALPRPPRARQGLDAADRRRARPAPLRGPRHGGRDERRIGGQHDVRAGQPRRPRRVHRQGVGRRARQRVRPRPQRRRRGVPAGRPRRGDADRALHHRRHARRAADDEHVPRRRRAAVVRRPRRGRHRRRRGALHGGLPVRSRRRQEGVPAGRRRGPRRRAHRLADAVGLVLRRPPPRRLRRPRPRRGRHPVRQRRRAVLPVRARLPRRRHRPRPR